MTNLIVHLEPSPQGRGVFFPGNMVKGIVELSLNEVKKFRGFYVVVYGFARAHWTETRTSSTGSGRNRRTTHHTVHYEGKEVFLNSKTFLFGHEGAEAREVQPGIHRYNFSCQLPDLIPATMDAVHGNISYYVEAVLDIPWRFDKEVKVLFTVARHDDLNMYPELRMAQKMDEIKTFCCFFCESGPLVMKVTVPHSGFAAGEHIPVSVHYTNRSNVLVYNTRIKLKRVISFTSYTPSTKTRTDRETMVEIIKDGVGENATTDSNHSIEIPRILMNSNARFCQVVRVEYYLKVEGVVGDCHTNPSVEIPITIGSVGFQSTTYLVQPQPTAPADTLQMPSAPIANGDEKDDLPPSFEEAVNMVKPQVAPTAEASTLGWNITKP